MFTPTLGRWLQMDPEGFEAGDINLYRSLNNSPLLFTDALGLQGDKAIGFDLMTSIANIKATLNDGIAGFRFNFNFNLGSDPGRKFFLQAMKKQSFGITSEGKLVVGDGADGKGNSYKIDQSYTFDRPKPEVVTDSRSLTTGQKGKERFIFYYQRVESVAGLSDFRGTPKQNGYRPLLEKNGDIRNNSVADLKDYNFVLAGIKSRKTPSTTTYTFFGPDEKCDAAFVIKAINKAGIDAKAILGAKPEATLGTKQFEKLDFAELFGKSNPLVGNK